MFKALLKTRLLALWHTMFARSSAKKLSKGKKALFGLLALYIVVQLSLSMAMLFGTLADGLFPMGLEQLYFCVAAILGFSLCFIGSVFMTQSLVFDARDTELLLSMPIPNRYIVASRFLPLFVLNYIYSGIMMIPALVICFMHAGFDAKRLVFYVIGMLLLPFLSAAVTCIFAWISALATSRSKGKVLVQTVTTVALLGGYMIVNFNMQNYLTKLIENGENALNAIEKAFPPFFWFGQSAAFYDFTALLKFALCCVVPFVLVYALISKSFFSLSFSHKQAAKKQYVQTSMKVSGARAALVRKELGRFFSMPNYMLNCGIGAIFAIMLSAAVLIKGGDVLETLLPITNGSQYTPAIFCIAICFCTIMCNSASVSISLEGKSFGILKAMPVSAKDIFFAKVITNLVISLPCALISVFAGWYAFNAPVYYKFAMLAVCAATAIFGASLGITVNSHFPKFDWLNATVVIKQSMSATICIFGGMGTIIVPSALYGFLLKNFIGIAEYLFIVAGVLLLAATGMLMHIRASGEKLYRDMG